MIPSARAGLGLLTLVSALLGCQRDKPQELVSRASFGIFFGGQIQEREEIPFELDRARQVLGFRVDFSEPLVREVKVNWEIDRPAPGKRPVSGKQSARIVEVGEAVGRKGLSRFDQVIAFRPGDALGSWKILVKVDDKVVIDRGVVIYDAAARAREEDSGAAP